MRRANWMALRIKNCIVTYENVSTCVIVMAWSRMKWRAIRATTLYWMTDWCACWKISEKTESKYSCSPIRIGNIPVWPWITSIMAKMSMTTSKRRMNGCDSLTWRTYLSCAVVWLLRGYWLWLSVVTYTRMPPSCSHSIQHAHYHYSLQWQYCRLM